MDRERADTSNSATPWFFSATFGVSVLADRVMRRDNHGRAH
jgi:hypothetical protein